MTLPPLPKTEWLLHMPASRYENEWTSCQDGYTEDHMHDYGEACALAERERCAKLCDEHHDRWMSLGVETYASVCMAAAAAIREAPKETPAA